MADIQENRPFPGQFNSVQLNVIIYLDVKRALRNQSLDGAVFMTDNSPDSTGKGTPALQTVCRQGQVINWLIYPMDVQQVNGVYPPFGEVNNIVFVTPGGENVIYAKIAQDFKIFGGPDKVRSRFTPVFTYWAGTVTPDLKPGNYEYRLVLEIDNPANPDWPLYLNLNELPSLKVIPVQAGLEANNMSKELKPEAS